VGLTMTCDLTRDEAPQYASTHPWHPHMTDHFASPTPMPSQVDILDDCYRLTGSSSVTEEGITLMHNHKAIHHSPGRHPATGGLSIAMSPNMTQGGAAVLSPP
jgi:hypothetical protein